MQRPVRLGLIGCGGIVRLSHAPGYRAIPELVRVSALADPAADNLRLLGEMLAVRRSGVTPTTATCWRRASWTR